LIAAEQVAQDGKESGMKSILISLGMAPLAVVALTASTPSVAPEVTESVDSGCPETRAIGRIEGATPEIEIRPRVSGRIVQVLVRPGQFVEPGQILLHLDDRQYRQDVAIAAAQLDGAEAQLQRLHQGTRDERQAELSAICRAKQAELDVAHARLGRIQRLGQPGAISEETVDHSETRVIVLTAETLAARARLAFSQAAPRPDEIHIAEARIRAARARLEMARVQLRRTRPVAPRHAQVLDVEAMVGELTGPNAKQPAVVLADTTGTQVRAFLEEKDAVRASVGMEATIVADGAAGCQFRGRVTRVRPRMEPKRFSSDDPAERFDVDTREIWIALETTEPPLIGLRVRVILDADPRVDTDTAGLASLGSNRWLAASSLAGRP
jgi:multidrug resistance efflux pump